MSKITFITGNQSKADYLAKYLGYSVEHHKLDLDEIQSLDLQKVVEHKVKQAYKIIKKPVLVEDVSLEFAAFGRLPGTFIKFFIDEIGLETICRMLDGKSREATGKCIYGYYDGSNLRFFEGKLAGKIAENPGGENGFGWDKVFIPENFTVTRASLNEDDYKKTYVKLRPIAELKKFLGNANS